jgi:hypothetical protein
MFISIPRSAREKSIIALRKENLSSIAMSGLNPFKPSPVALAQIISTQAYITESQARQILDTERDKRITELLGGKDFLRYLREQLKY